VLQVDLGCQATGGMAGVVDAGAMCGEVGVMGGAQGTVEVRKVGDDIAAEGQAV
jgi:hypothetical protein